MHQSVHDWLVNSGEMVIYAVLNKFKSNNQKHAISKSRLSDQKLQTLPHKMHYIAKTSKVQKNKLIQAKQGT